MCLTCELTCEFDVLSYNEVKLTIVSFINSSVQLQQLKILQ